MTWWESMLKVMGWVNGHVTLWKWSMLPVSISPEQNARRTLPTSHLQSQSLVHRAGFGCAAGPSSGLGHLQIQGRLKQDTATHSAMSYTTSEGLADQSPDQETLTNVHWENTLSRLDAYSDLGKKQRWSVLHQRESFIHLKVLLDLTVHVSRGACVPWFCSWERGTKDELSVQ